MVYARVPDNRLELAIDVMAEMVYRPVFAEVDSEREVVLEEIAMVEDTPHDLVHDLAAEAVFGSHPLGRPVIGRAEVISTVSRRALAALPPPRVRRRAARGRRRRERPPRPARRARRGASERRRDGGRALPAKAGAPPPGPRPALPAQGDGAVPRLPRGTGHRERRRAAVCGIDPRRDRRRLRVVAALPGDPREAGHGVLRVQLRIAVRRHGAGRPLRRHAKREPAALPRDRGRGARRSRERKRSPGRALAREGEPEGPPAPVAGVDVEPDDEAREGDGHGPAAARGQRDPAPARDGHRRGRRGARAGALRAREALRSGNRPGRGALPRGGRAGEPRRS